MDRFPNYKTLRRHAKENRDYVVELRNGRTGLAVMAPHGGGIEPGTDIIAAAIAGADHAFYAFRGIRPSANAYLHITSERFDEPRALALVNKVQSVVTIHGCRHSRPAVFVGGMDLKFKDTVTFALQRAGFDVRRSDMPGLEGVHPRNLCNRGRRGKGIQLEISDTLRRRLLCGTGGRKLLRPAADLAPFVSSIRSALASLGYHNPIWI